MTNDLLVAADTRASIAPHRSPGTPVAWSVRFSWWRRGRPCHVGRSRLGGGDRAFLQQDWDSAVANYQQAMRKARSPEEVECIRPRLDGSCTRSG